MDYYSEIHRRDKKKFVPGDRIPYSGRIFDEQEVLGAVEASLEFWLTAGKHARSFETSFAQYLGVRHCSLTNSGSSANLLALVALTSPKLGEQRLRKDDEVITVAAGFPTTITPIIQCGAVPVFVDISLPAYNIDCAQLEAALSPRTKAVFLAHTLGNPFNLEHVRNFCDAHGYWLVEDNCDALGAEFHYKGVWKKTGTIGHLGTSSFYPAHHITMGEGGAVYTDDLSLRRIVESFRDWGRDCWCLGGHDNTCGNRFTQKFGELPVGYDHKYVYSHFGYNLKITEMQAAIGCAQLEKLPSFIEARRKNWNVLRKGLDDTADSFILPEIAPNSRPSWFGFILTVRDDAGFTRDEIVNYLEGKGIQTRTLFAGNIIRHTCFDEMRATGEGYRVAGELKNTDLITSNTFWIGVYPGMTDEMNEFIIESIHGFVQGKR